MAISLLKTKVIDVVGGTPDHSLYTLTLLDNLHWQDGRDENHLRLLQEKINSYLHYIEEGEIYELFPKAKGAKFRIEILTQFPPVSQWGIEFLAKAKLIVGDLGIHLNHTTTLIDFQKALDTANP